MELSLMESKQKDMPEDIDSQMAAALKASLADNNVFAQEKAHNNSPQSNRREREQDEIENISDLPSVRSLLNPIDSKNKAEQEGEDTGEPENNP